MIHFLFFCCLLVVSRYGVKSSLQNDNKDASREEYLKEEIELFHKSFSSSSSSSASVIPFLINLSVSHKFFPQPYSFNEWEWLSFPRLLLSTKSLCQKDATFYSSWTLPIKCEYYLLIRALRLAKDKENELNDKEKNLIQSYIDEIYGKKEEYEKIKEKLKSSFLSKNEKEELFHLTTILESNELVDLLINDNYKSNNNNNNGGDNEISSFIKEKRILEKCSFQHLSIDSSSFVDTKSSLSSFSIGFFFVLNESHFFEYYIQKKKISEMIFFQHFVKSFLQFYQNYSKKLEEQQRNQEQQDQSTENSSNNNQLPSLEFLFSLFVGYDSDLHSSYHLSASSSSISNEPRTSSSNGNLIEDFSYALKYFFPFFQVVFLKGYENMNELVYNSNSKENYDFQSILKKKEEFYYNFPFLYKELIKENHFLSSSSAKQPMKSIDYYFLIQDSFVISSDFTFFHSILDSLVFTNPFLPNFGILTTFDNKEKNNFLLFHSSYYEIMKDFPLSFHVLNNSYLNEKQSYPSIDGKDKQEEIIDYSWNSMYFTFLDIFSVFQPFLFQKNAFLEYNSINHSLLISSSTTSVEKGTETTVKVDHNKWISKGFSKNIHRYKVFIERNRRHISKWLSRNDVYLSYHTCINEEINSVLMEEENKHEVMTESKADGSSRIEKKEEENDFKESNEAFSHPVQFFWRPNQLLYEVNGIFSEINF
jgi:hypothetical protein